MELRQGGPGPLGLRHQAGEEGSQAPGAHSLTPGRLVSMTQSKGRMRMAQTHLWR